MTLSNRRSCFSTGTTCAVYPSPLSIVRTRGSSTSSNEPTQGAGFAPVLARAAATAHGSSNARPVAREEVRRASPRPQPHPHPSRSLPCEVLREWRRAPPERRRSLRHDQPSPSPQPRPSPPASASPSPSPRLERDSRRLEPADHAPLWGVEHIVPWGVEHTGLLIHGLREQPPPGHSEVRAPERQNAQGEQGRRSREDDPRLPGRERQGRGDVFELDEIETRTSTPSARPSPSPGPRAVIHLRR